MDIAAVERDFHSKVGAQIRLEKEEGGRYRVSSPFEFGDGDHLVIFLVREDDGWALTDRAHTLMHLSYSMDEEELERGPSAAIIRRVLSSYSVENRNGELVLAVRDGDYGRALYDYVQALLQIVYMTSLRKARLASALPAEVRRLVREAVPSDQVTPDWHDPARDPECRYRVDYRIEGVSEPTFVFALPDDEKVRDATIALHQFEKWGLRFSSVGIFESEEEIDRRVLARFSDVCDKLFSSLPANRDRIQRYLRETRGGVAA